MNGGPVRTARSVLHFQDYRCGPARSTPCSATRSRTESAEDGPTCFRIGDNRNGRRSTSGKALRIDARASPTLCAATATEILDRRQNCLVGLARSSLIQPPSDLRSLPPLPTDNRPVSQTPLSFSVDLATRRSRCVAVAVLQSVSLRSAVSWSVGRHSDLSPVSDLRLSLSPSTPQVASLVAAAAYLHSVSVSAFSFPVTPFTP